MSKINGVAKQLSAKISYELEEEKFAPGWFILVLIAMWASTPFLIIRQLT